MAKAAGEGHKEYTCKEREAYSASSKISGLLVWLKHELRRTDRREVRM
jgi:hypothetical protein